MRRQRLQEDWWCSVLTRMGRESERVGAKEEEEGGTDQIELNVSGRSQQDAQADGDKRELGLLREHFAEVECFQDHHCWCSANLGNLSVGAWRATSVLQHWHARYAAWCITATGS